MVVQASVSSLKGSGQEEEIRVQAIQAELKKLQNNEQSKAGLAKLLWVMNKLGGRQLNMEGALLLAQDFLGLNPEEKEGFSRALAREISEKRYARENIREKGKEFDKLFEQRQQYEQRQRKITFEESVRGTLRAFNASSLAFIMWGLGNPLGESFRIGEEYSSTKNLKLEDKLLEAVAKHPTEIKQLLTNKRADDFKVLAQAYKEKPLLENQIAENTTKLATLSQAYEEEQNKRFDTEQGWSDTLNQLISAENHMKRQEPTLLQLKKKREELVRRCAKLRGEVQNLAQQNQEKQEAIDDLGTQQQKTLAEYYKYQRENINLTDAKEQLSQENEMLGQENKELKKKAFDLESKVKTAGFELEQQKKQAAAAKEQLGKESEQLRNASEQLRNASEQLRLLEEKLEIAEKQPKEDPKLKKQLAEHEKAIESLETQLKDVGQKVVLETSRADKFADDYWALAAEHTETSKLLKDFMRSDKEKETQLGEKETLLKKLQEEHSSLKTEYSAKLKQSEEMIRGIEKQLSQKAEGISKLEEKLSFEKDKSEKDAKIIAELEKQIESYKSDVESLAKEKEAKEDSLNELKETLFKLSEQIEIEKDKAANLKREYELIGQRFLEKDDELKKIKTGYAALEQRISQKNRQVDELNKGCDELKTQTKDLEGKLRTAQETVAKLSGIDKELNEVRGVIRARTEELIQKNETIEKLSSAVKQLDMLLREQGSASRTALEKQKKDYLNQIEVIENGKVVLEEKLKHSQNLREELEAQRDSYKSKFEKLDKELNAKASEGRVLEESVSKLSRELKQKESELESVSKSAMELKERMASQREKYEGVSKSQQRTYNRRLEKVLNKAKSLRENSRALDKQLVEALDAQGRLKSEMLVLEQNARLLEQDAKAQSAELRQKLADLNGKYEKEKKNTEFASATANAYKEAAGIASQKLKELTKIADEAKNKLEATAGELTGAKEKAASLETKLAETDAKYKQQMDSAREERNTKCRVIQEFNKTLDSLKQAEEELKKGKAEFASLNAELENYKMLKPKLDKELFDTVAKLSEARNYIKLLESEKKELEKYASLKSELSDTVNKLSEAQKYISALESEKQELERCKSLEPRLEQTTRKLAKLADECVELRAKLERKTNELAGEKTKSALKLAGEQIKYGMLEAGLRADYEKKIAGYEKQIKEQQATIEKQKLAEAGLKEKIIKYETAQKEDMGKQTAKDEAIKNLEGKVAEQDGRIKDLEESLGGLSEQYNEEVTEQAESHEKRIAGLKERYEKELAKKNEKIAGLEGEVKSLNRAPVREYASRLCSNVLDFANKVVEKVSKDFGFKDISRYKGPSADELKKEGLSFLEQEDYKDAFKCFKRALRLNPDKALMSELLHNKGVVFDRKKNYETALKYYRQSYELDAHPATKQGIERCTDLLSVLN